MFSPNGPFRVALNTCYTYHLFFVRTETVVFSASLRGMLYVTWARGITTAYGYSAQGNLLSIDYSDSTPDVAFTYDRLGRQLSAIADGVSTNLYAYSLYGQLTNEVVSGNASLSRSYDTLGRSTGYALDEGGATLSQLAAVSYGYDTYGRFASVVAEGGGLPSAATFTYSYLPNSSLISGMTASSGHAWTRSYEPSRNLISTVENTFGETVISRFDYANDEIGRRTAISRSGTAFDTPIRDAYGYNTRSEVTSARRALADNPNQGVRGFSYDYAYDPIGNRTSSTEYDHEDHARVSSYTANELNQYEQRTVPGYAGVRGSATNNATVTVNGNTAWRLGEYFYGGDDADNAASAVMKELETLAVVNPPGTNEADIVQSVTGKAFVAKSPEAFTYDDDGNLLSDGRFVYTWDGENRLVSIETSEAAASAGAPRVRVAYTYDPRSRRVGKVVSHFENDTWTVSESRSFVYDGWNMVQEFSTFNSQLSILNSYVWGLDLSGSLQGAGGVGGLLAVAQGGTVYYPTFDGNGNVCEYSSTDGTIVAHYEYSPFGETVVQSGDLADAFSFRFSSKYWEKEAGLYYYGYRFYVPGAGRWLNRDPIGEWGGIHLLLSLRNNPIARIDKLGRAPMGWGPSSSSDIHFPDDPSFPLPLPDPWEDFSFPPDPSFDPNNPLAVPDPNFHYLPESGINLGFGINFGLGGAGGGSLSCGTCCQDRVLYYYEIITICGGAGVGFSALPLDVEVSSACGYSGETSSGNACPPPMRSFFKTGGSTPLGELGAFVGIPNPHDQGSMVPGKSLSASLGWFAQVCTSVRICFIKMGCCDK